MDARIISSSGVDQHACRSPTRHRPWPARSELPKPSTSTDHRHEQDAVDPGHVDLADGVRRRCARSACAAGSRAGSPGAPARTRRRSPPARRSPWPAVASTIIGISAPSGHQAVERIVDRCRDARAAARPGRNSSAPGPAARRTTRRSGSGMRPKWPMSAYSASPPVTASTTAPSTSQAVPPWSMKNMHRVPGIERVQHLRVLDDLQHARAPPGTMNQSTMTGPKILPTLLGAEALDREQADQDDQRRPARRSRAGSAQRPPGPRPPTAPRSPA